MPTFRNKPIDDGGSSPESKDFSQDSNQDKFNKDNIDFEDLKNKLSKYVYDDKRLTDNAIRHIKQTIGSPVEIQWETGAGTKILNFFKGSNKSVDLHKPLISRARRNVKTLQVLHNHTSGIPLPHPEDMIILLKYKVVNSGINGNYGFFNMKNSFKKYNYTKKELNKLRINANHMFNKLEKEAFKNNPYFKFQSDMIRSEKKYKYYKMNIQDIIKEYNKEFKQYGIEFNYVPYQLK